ncbi:MAG: hypothetical protein EZS28_001326 [Streblomastix strix]|uniref:Thioredoxin domain-containing protein n=1 Tax=Streblomastix strix TaxID=222440 RepID=A0A5J4X7C8_9EUKA|nr:MAG: hypothetical protein EZS28_001326 [Streblomastix strix]
MMTIASLELCSKCKRIEPLFDQLAQNTSGFNFGDVDCEAHKLICQVNKIDKYPQIKLIRGNVAFATFEGDFNEKEMREWVEKMTGPSLLIVGDEEKKDGGDTDETIQSSSQLHNKKQNTNSRITTDEFLNQLQEIQERSSFVMISSEPPSQRYVQTPDRMQQHKSLMSQNRKSFKNEGIQDNEDIKMSITQYEEIANEYYSIGSRFYYIQYPMTKGPIETSTNLNDGEKEKEKEKVFDKQKMFDQREQIDRDTGNVIQNAQIVHMATKQTEELRGALHDLHIEKVLEQLGMSREEMIAFKEISWSAKEELRIMRQQNFLQASIHFEDNDKLFFVIADEQAFSNFSGYYYINSHRIPDVFVVSWIKHLNWTINIGNNSWNKDSIISFLSSVLNKKIRPGSPYQLDKSGISRFTENHPVIIGISIGLLIFGIGILAVLLLLRSEDRHQQIENMRLAKIRAVEQTALKEAELYKQRLLQEEEDEAELAQDIDEQELEREIILKLMKEKARKEKKKKKKQQQKKSNLEMKDESVRNGNNEIQDEDNQTHFKDGIIENKESGNADKIQEDPHSDKVE